MRFNVVFRTPGGWNGRSARSIGGKGEDEGEGMLEVGG